MSMVVDTCILLDILDDHPDFSASSALALNRYSDSGLIIAPVTYVEMSPAFCGSRELQDKFLDCLGIAVPEAINESALAEANAAWNRHIQRKRAGNTVKRPIADVMIGALASANEGLITRNARDFRTLFPNLDIIVP